MLTSLFPSALKERKIVEISPYLLENLQTFMKNIVNILFILCLCAALPAAYAQADDLDFSSLDWGDVEGWQDLAPLPVDMPKPDKPKPDKPKPEDDLAPDPSTWDDPPKPPAEPEDLAPLPGENGPIMMRKTTYFKDNYLDIINRSPALPSIHDLAYDHVCGSGETDRCDCFEAHKASRAAIKKLTQKVRDLRSELDNLSEDWDEEWIHRSHQSGYEQYFERRRAFGEGEPDPFGDRSVGGGYERAKLEYLLEKNRLVDMRNLLSAGTQCLEIVDRRDEVIDKICIWYGDTCSDTMCCHNKQHKDLYRDEYNDHDCGGCFSCARCNEQTDHKPWTDYSTVWHGYSEKALNLDKQNVNYAIRLDEMEKRLLMVHSEKVVFSLPYSYLANVCRSYLFVIGNTDCSCANRNNLEGEKKTVERQEKVVAGFEALMIKAMSPAQKARWEKEKKWYEENERKKTREIKKRAEEFERQRQDFEEWLKERARRENMEKQIDDLAPLGSDLDDLAPLGMYQQAVPSGGVPTATIAQPQPAVAQNAQAQLTKAQRVANSTPQGIVDGCPPLPEVQDLCNPNGNVHALEKFKNEVMMRDIYVERKLHKLIFSFDAWERIEAMSDAELDKAIEKLVAFNKSSLEIDMANMKDEISASEKIDAIRANYPKEADALKRDTECYTIWREHIVGVQKRLQEKLKVALEVDGETAYSVSKEYLSSAADVVSLPPPGYAESLKKSLAEWDASQ